MSRWPDFFIVGAPRAGTTSLYYYLKGHPNIFLPSIKEPHFFNKKEFDAKAVVERVMRALPPNPIRTENAYLKLFQTAQASQVVGEASVSYLADTIAPQRIWDKNPSAKIVILLRQPIDRAYSFYLLSTREGAERLRSFSEALQEDYQFMTGFDGAGSIYIEPGLYYKHVKRYLETFGSERVRIYLHEDLASNAAGVVDDLCGFLEVPYGDGSFFDATQIHNAYAAPRNKVFQWLASSRRIWLLAHAIVPMQPLPFANKLLFDTGHSKQPLQLKDWRFLNSIYSEDMLKLQTLIGRDLSSWFVEPEETPVGLAHGE